MFTTDELWNIAKPLGIQRYMSQKGQTFEDVLDLMNEYMFLFKKGSRKWSVATSKYARPKKSPAKRRF